MQDPSKFPSELVDARSVLAAAGVVVVALDRRGDLTLLNRKACDVLGYEPHEVIGRNWFDVFEPDDAGGFARKRFDVVAGGQDEPVEHYEGVVRAKDGRRLVIAWHTTVVRAADGAIAGVLCCGEDVTRRKEAEAVERDLEDRLRQTKRMESLGTLAGGIAHEFNNILAAILGFTDLIRQDLAPGSEAERHAEEVLRAADRARLLVNQILTFSRRDEPVFQAVDLRGIVNESLRALRKIAPKDVVVRAELGSREATVLVDVSQMHTLLVNLGRNALRAMPDGGKLTVCVDEVDADEALAAELGTLEGVRLSVRDTGCGIDDETMRRMFEPFFTTKDVGEGPGLGLSVVHGIVHLHGGTIRVDSEAGRGAAFEVVLPRHEGEAVPPNRPSRDALRGDERLLLVDDEPGLLYVMRRQLEDLGYAVRCFTRGADALAAFRSLPHGYELVITDQAMEGMSGLELAERVHAIRPDVPVVMITGLGPDLTELAALRGGIASVLRKPYRTGQLAPTVRAVLDQAASPAAD